MVFAIHFTTSSNIAENTNIITGFKFHAAINTAVFILGQNASRTVYYGAFSNNGNTLANLVTYSAIPSGANIRAVVTVTGTPYF